MELIVLGGSAAAPNPGDACAGYLVMAGATRLLLDCGSGVVSRLRAQIDARALTGVLITHLHSDHTLDLVALRYTLKYAPGTPLAAPIPLHLPPGGRDFLARLADVYQEGNEAGQDFWGEVFAVQEFDPAGSLDVGDVTVRFAPMVHYIPVWAVRLEERATDRALTFSADAGPQSPLADFAAGSDLLLCEATLLRQAPGQAPEDYGHLTAAEAGCIAARAGAHRLVLTHMWAELGFERYLADARRTFSGPVELARSGAVFTA